MFASLTHVSPYAVGADIGCGMIAAPIHNLTIDNFPDRSKIEIQQRIKTAIPTGHNARIQAYRKADTILRQLGPCSNYLKKEISDLTKKQVT